MGLCHALDMALVDHHLLIRDLRRAVVAPVEERVDHHRQHRVAERVFFIATGTRFFCVDVVGKQRGMLIKLPIKGARVRVHEQLAGIATLAVGRVPRPVHAVAITLTWANTGQVSVPDMVIHLVEGDTRFGAGVVDKTKLNCISNPRKQCKVRPRPIKRRAQRMCGARPDLLLQIRMRRLSHAARA